MAKIKFLLGILFSVSIVDSSKFMHAEIKKDISAIAKNINVKIKSNLSKHLKVIGFDQGRKKSRIYNEVSSTKCIRLCEYYDYRKSN